ncbi:MAG: hypothetical protein ABJO09_06360 [Hyphomicrobiales bacterium]
MEIDATTIAWYAVVCGILSACAPSLGGLGLRLAIGGGVGIFAASVLPFIRGMMGY